MNFKMGSFIFYAFFIKAITGVSPLANFNFPRMVFKLMFLTWPLHFLKCNIEPIHLKTILSEPFNFESAASRYLPRELLATKFQKRNDLKNFVSPKARVANYLRRILMTHNFEWSETQSISVTLTDWKRLFKI